MKKKKAFTLSEVLIVLAIIGVVAALTMPMLMNNYQKTQQIVGLKKTYSQITDAIDRLMIDENVEKFSETTLHDQSTADPKAFFKKYFRVSKFCDDKTFESCFPTVTSLDKNTSGNPANGINCVVVKDGTSICLKISDSGNYPPVFTIDTNGLSKPNIAGRDVFSFSVYYDGSVDEVTPEALAGSESTARDGRNNFCESEYNYYGGGCLSKIIDAGWKMDY